MKNYLLGILFLFIALQCASQSEQKEAWSKDILKRNVTFKTVQEEFNREWSDKEYVKGQGWKQYKRWEAFWQHRLMPDGSFPKFSAAFDEYESYMSQFANANQASANGNWLPLGPFSHITTGSWSSGTGRINVVVQDPNNANTLYVGAPAGGIWKSTNSGSSWTPLSDYFAVIGISGIAVDPSDSNIIYVTTGDSDGGDTYSIGIWKSTDGGSSWNQAGTEFGQGNKILIDPINTSNIWVAANTGLYKSTNSGNSWTQLQSGNFRDIALKPSNPQTVYGVTNSKCFYTTNGGATFNESTGLPGGTNRLALTTTPAQSNTVYILAAGGSWEFAGVYKSTNSAVSFATQNNTTDIFNGSNQAWYDMAITVSDSNPNTLIAGVLNLWRSTDGGVNWTEINSWSNPSGASYTHADIHYLN